MKKILKYLTFGLGFTLLVSCQEFVDVNTNPNFPQVVEPVVLIPAMQAQMALAVQFDGRFLGKYVQNFAHSTAQNTWDRYGYDPGSDNGGQIWRMAYWDLGKNLSLMMEGAENESRWDLLGLGKVMRAWSWQMTTDMHGEIILTQAFDQTRKTFDYDSQEAVYAEVVKLANEGIGLLAKTDGAVSQAYMTRGDKIYAGDRAKWTKFAYGLLARNANNLINKSSYNPDKVIEYADKAMASINDDAMVAFDGTVSTNSSFWGPTRANMNAFRQTKFIVGLMDSTVFKGARDPRISSILVPSTDGVYRGHTANTAEVTTAAVRIPTPWGIVGAPTAATPGKYLFRNAAPFPLMTYAEMQFIKAEAAFIKGDKEMALTAYKNGISASIDMVNKYTIDPTPKIDAAAKAAFLAKPSIVPASASELSLSQIMTQKYIALFGFGFLETWNDMRKYHYDANIYKGLTFTSSLYPDNAGKLAYRIRPRYNSEYVWNLETLKKYGGDKPEYHTTELWFSQK
ncbi:MAG: SusD/RagB family nutrient-binding outer membrane lipoprotein [Cytophagaceae bacterium]|nr:SusD/RagB family nutrient-binding outer membrane lipoprotein [Cytophagaceae bacterium]MBK9508544.1 SusD/RagB family nutrient-binding outer membrane lipoprotein [Cytophagaceae bacterium]MBK9935433.1 SusD/RagB family nutrient-binding outer membrane lipoprotein [Cytophagaceae bacterium]MBL0301876.1 SusD/RagB family nutrient-binding outer membrane lipoprotein [Cytophagaceae bacterium]MBL0324703.1 SusD/RagB family nutrient-binding outer membrane lipoprotein [Cytophagaceae bacterium]